ncbi:MAG TPA: hypothetical protein PLF42_00895, partial [Anaerolineales bacterium]|nr:hypothetical protein [Anaerolineales bacterium]
MSGTTSPTAQKPKRNFFHLIWLVPLLGVGAVAILALAYYGIGFLLTRQVDTLYVARDCANLVQRAGYIERFYPSNIAPFTDPSREQAIECDAYLRADSLFEKQDWKAAYEAYLTYQTAYPNGIYRLESHNFAAEALFQIAAEQRSRQDFAGAVETLTLLARHYNDTPAIINAQAALPEVFLEWGQDCRAEEEFTEAETVYLSLTTWAKQENDQEYTTRAQTELAQAYFDWGVNLQSKKDFPNALSKFDKAILTDPNPNLADSTATKTRAHLPGFHRSWGMYLISQGKYAEAILQYRKSVDLSPPQDVNSAKDSLVQAYLNWAEALRTMEDYNQALEKIEDAQKSAGTENSKKDAEEAYIVMLSHFSKSRGAQAQKIISDATISICKNSKPLEALPIIGTLNEKRIALSGVTLSLPANI